MNYSIGLSALRNGRIYMHEFFTVKLLFTSHPSDVPEGKSCLTKNLIFEDISLN